MTDTSIRVHEHYSAAGLTDRIQQALATLAPKDQTLTSLNPLANQMMGLFLATAGSV